MIKVPLQKSRLQSCHYPVIDWITEFYIAILVSRGSPNNLCEIILRQEKSCLVKLQGEFKSAHVTAQGYPFGSFVKGNI